MLCQEGSSCGVLTMTGVRRGGDLLGGRLSVGARGGAADVRFY